MEMVEGETHVFKDMTLDEYKTIETRLYGELIKSCRRYSHKLSIISILGIIDIVKEEIKDLEKTHLEFMKDESSEEFEENVQQDKEVDPLDRMI